MRGIVTLAVIVAITAGLLASPVGARREGVGKRFVRNLVNNRISALRADLVSSIKDQGTSGFSSSIVGPVVLDSEASEVIVISLPVTSAGSYLVLAKLWWTPVTATSTGAGGEIDCDLLADSAFDTSREAGNSDFDYGALSLQLTLEAPQPFNATLRCRDEFSGGNPVQLHNVILTAVRLDDITRMEVRSAHGAEVVPEQRPTP